MEEEEEEKREEEREGQLARRVRHTRPGKMAAAALLPVSFGQRNILGRPVREAGESLCVCLRERERKYYI